MTETQRKKEAERQMKIYGITFEEAYEMVLDDEAVDKGEELPWDLTPEQKRVQKKARQADSKPKGDKVKRERKPNERKRELIEKIFQAVTDLENATIDNPEKLITFTYGGFDYKIDLVEHRKKKD